MSDLTHRRLRAPTADGFALIDPPLSQAVALIERNRAIGAQFDLNGGFAADFRAAARIMVLSAASPSQEGPIQGYLNKPWVLAGHQPEVFHPGVWLKNFVLSSVAQAVSGIGINLVIDNDTIRTSCIRVPAGDRNEARIVAVPFDGQGPEIPWERREILDPVVFDRFPAVAREAMASFLNAPAYKRGLLADWLWPAAREIARTQREPSNLGACLAGARHLIERELGLTTREAGLGAHCMLSRPFLEFMDRLLTRHRAFHSIYNAALAEYRAVNHIRSLAQPIPDLALNGEWYEMPFWCWTFDDPTRRRVFVKQAGNSWQLTDRQGVFVDGALDDLWGQTVLTGISLRPRALITTMYARLVLSDLFIHGIGGAKYDEVTDLIIRRFFGVEPPAYVTATATFRLPIERPQVSLEDVRNSARRIREARYRPEAFVRDPLVTGDAEIAPKLAALAAEKREYLARHDLRRCSPEVFHKLDALNRAMHEQLAPVERELRAEHAELIAQAKQSQLLGSREFSFVLFPSEILPARLLDLCKVSS